MWIEPVNRIAKYIVLVLLSLIHSRCPGVPRKEESTQRIPSLLANSRLPMCIHYQYPLFIHPSHTHAQARWSHLTAEKVASIKSSKSCQNRKIIRQTILTPINPQKAAGSFFHLQISTSASISTAIATVLATRPRSRSRILSAADTICATPLVATWPGAAPVLGITTYTSVPDVMVV